MDTVQVKANKLVYADSEKDSQTSKWALSWLKLNVSKAAIKEAVRFLDIV